MSVPMKLPPGSHGTKRSLTIVAATIVIVALFLLAASLTRLELKPGESFDLPRLPEAPSASPAIEFPAIIFDVFLVMVAIAFVVSMVMLLRSPRERRLLLRNVGQLLLLAAIALLVSNLYRPEEQMEVRATPQRAPHPASGPSEGIETSGTPVPVAFAPPVAPGWVRFAVTLTVVLLAGALGYWGWRLLPNPKRQVQGITLSALDDLFAGRNWEDVVIQCYADMSATVSRQRGVGRHPAMTPREFAVRLEQIGLPAGSVSRLTRLFEQARYGSHQSAPDQVQEAIDCLVEIIRAVAEPSVAGPAVSRIPGPQSWKEGRQ